MNDLLAVILVGLVVLTAVVSVFIILNGSSTPYTETDYPRSDAGAKIDLRK